MYKCVAHVPMRLCVVQAKVTGTAAGSNMGFIEGFSLIFMSELGDKTFFIAALLAMKVGKAVSFFGSTAALTVMTVISVSIGVMCAQVPAFIHSSIPVGEYLGAALLVFFGTHVRSQQSCSLTQLFGAT